MIQKLSRNWSKRVGTKAVNALSNYFRVESVRDEKQKSSRILRRKFGSEEEIIDTTKRKVPSYFYSDKPFLKLQIPHGICSEDDQNYCYLNNGLTII
jgi:topoisomerase-4 subunit B